MLATVVTMYTAGGTSLKSLSLLRPAAQLPARHRDPAINAHLAAPTPIPCSGRAQSADLASPVGLLLSLRNEVVAAVYLAKKAFDPAIAEVAAGVLSVRECNESMLAFALEALQARRMREPLHFLWDGVCERAVLSGARLPLQRAEAVTLQLLAPLLLRPLCLPRSTPRPILAAAAAAPADVTGRPRHSTQRISRSTRRA